MYPSHFFGLFPPFPREDNVFVAMSFASRFDQRWNEVIAPAIHRVLRNEVPLEPLRVDSRKVSDSILTEILDGISKSRLVLADITTVGKLDGTPIRNGNVMYEVGIAHAVRLPEEVLLFRSDKDALLFDTSSVRVNEYQPETSPDEARDIVASAILDAFREMCTEFGEAVLRQTGERMGFTSPEVKELLEQRFAAETTATRST
jgi:hypothetical protein